MVNVLTAGVVSPLLWDSPRSLALGMLAMMLIGFASWRFYEHSTKHPRGTLPPSLPEA